MHLQTRTLKKHRQAGLSLVEVILTAGLFATVGTVSTLLFANLQGTVNRSTSEMEATKRTRWVMERAVPMLSSAYQPAIPGANSALEVPVAPLAAGASASDPLNPNGPGNDSVLFYSCTDLMDGKRVLPASTGMTPHLYEIRLDPISKPDPTGQGIVLRDLVLREYQVPANFGDRPLVAKPNVQPRVLARGLSDFRVIRQTTSNLRLTVSVNYTQSTLRYRNRMATVKNYTVTGNAVLPNLCLR
ncbi:hypothetical protein JST97_18140 [bacterium]|nr:hypothetical protein [bacterium]